jgi:hypothetical protein
MRAFRPHPRHFWHPLTEKAIEAANLFSFRTGLLGLRSKMTQKVITGMNLLGRDNFLCDVASEKTAADLNQSSVS